MNNNMKTECDYCNKPKEKLSEMLSNGYRICGNCSIKCFNKSINELETMFSKNQREAKLLSMTN